MSALLLVVLLCLAYAGGTAASVAVVPSQASSQALLRFPNSNGKTVVFSARGHLWLVANAGGTARQLTDGPNYEFAPRYSPDGRWIAFTGDRSGQQDVYLIPAAGDAIERRLTWLPPLPSGDGPKRPTQEGLVVTWTPDSKSVIFLSRRSAWNSWQYRPYSVPIDGGEPITLPIDRSGYLTFGPDGHSFALNRIFSDFRTWKRYDGGLAQDVYTYDPATKLLARITDWKGNDSDPMWVGNRIYFVSDRDANRRANIWVYDRTTRQMREVTHFTDYDIDLPSYGGGEITFQDGGNLWTIDLPSERLRALRVVVPDDGTRTMPRLVRVDKLIRDEDTDYDTDYRLSPKGDAAVFSARGDIFVVPVNGGVPRDITATSNAEEDHPVWSPDGKWIAYTTDASGEQQLAIRSASGGPERQLTHLTSGFLYEPVWSPDGRTIAIHDAAHRLWIVSTASGTPKLVAYNRFHFMHEVNEHDAVFSPDGRWLAFSTSRPTRLRALHLYNIGTGDDTIVSSPDESDYRPAFSADGQYLYFVSDRHAISVSSDRETNALTVKSGGVYVASLDKEVSPVFQPEQDGAPTREDNAPPQPCIPAPAKAIAATTVGTSEDERSTSTLSVKPRASIQPERAVKVDLADLMLRAVPVPVEPNNIVALDVRAGKLVYQTDPPDTLAGSLPGEKSSLHYYDLEQLRDTTVVEDLDSYTLSADGCSVLYKLGGDHFVATASGNQFARVKLNLDGLHTRIDPRQEWREMFDNAWRLERDLFVNANMNGTDWNAVHDRYAKLLPLVSTRDDLNYLIGQLIGEMSSSHTYVGGGDDGQTPSRVSMPLLGADIVLDAASKRYRFDRIYDGDNTRSAYRSPLSWPGVDVHQGDYLLAIDGQELNPPTTSESLLAGREGAITLTVSSSAAGERRTVSVVPVTSEFALRRSDWIERNRRIVDRLSGGRVGYVYLADMQNLGMEEFVQQFYPQLERQALIIDDRWNEGGNVDQIILERLRRVLSSMQTGRDRVPQTQPDQLFSGPKVMLINHFSASDGDMFAYHFREYGLGKLIGTRTWGGVRGIRTFWTLLDGGYVTVPEITFYNADHHWIVENHGLDPDIEVEDVPSEYETGRDVQLETAVASVMADISGRRSGAAQPPPPLPAYPAGSDVP